MSAFRGKHVCVVVAPGASATRPLPPAHSSTYSLSSLSALGSRDHSYQCCACHISSVVWSGVSFQPPFPEHTTRHPCPCLSSFRPASISDGQTGPARREASECRSRSRTRRSAWGQLEQARICALTTPAGVPCELCRVYIFSGSFP